MMLSKIRRLLTAAVMLLFLCALPAALADCDHQVKCGTNTCTLCGATGVTGYVIHNYQRVYYNDTQHVVKCATCGNVNGYENHTYNCSTGVCTGCGSKVSGGTVTHSWSGNVYYDETYHINTCSSCGATVKEKHEVISNGACTGCNATGLTPTTGSSSSSSSSSKSSSSSSSSSTKQTVKTLSSTAAVYLKDDDGERGSEVSIVTLGITECVVMSSGKTLTVPTTQLEFDTEAPDDMKLASIYAPRAGKVSLRKTSSMKSAIKTKCASGVIVLVLSVEDDIACINYQGTEGYVMADSLVFWQPQEAEGTGMLHYNGKTGGKKNINIRTKADKGSFSVAKVPTGTTLNILSHTEKWYVVEHEGVIGYVQAAYLNVLTMNETKAEPPATASGDEEAEPEEASDDGEAEEDAEPEEDDLMIEEDDE